MILLYVLFLSIKTYKKFKLEFNIIKYIKYDSVEVFNNIAFFIIFLSCFCSPANPQTEPIHKMSQQSEFLDDSDLEDEAFLLELEQQVSSKSGAYSTSASLQQRQLTTIL